jgi:hypothetical protein
MVSKQRNFLITFSVSQDGNVASITLNGVNSTSNLKVESATGLPSPSVAVIKPGGVVHVAA